MLRKTYFLLPGCWLQPDANLFQLAKQPKSVLLASWTWHWGGTFQLHPEHSMQAFGSWQAPIFELMSKATVSIHWFRFFRAGSEEIAPSPVSMGPEILPISRRLEQAFEMVKTFTQQYGFRANIQARKWVIYSRWDCDMHVEGHNEFAKWCNNLTNSTMIIYCMGYDTLDNDTTYYDMTICYDDMI